MCLEDVVIAWKNVATTFSPIRSNTTITRFLNYEISYCPRGYYVNKLLPGQNLKEGYNETRKNISR